MTHIRDTDQRIETDHRALSERDMSPSLAPTLTIQARGVFAGSSG
jgi:hypothetical protein